MEIKTIEVRDKCTFIPALAILLHPRDEADKYLLARAGFTTFQDRTVILLPLNGTRAENDPVDWGDRTMQVAHEVIETTWYNIPNGAVIDVEYALGETNYKKDSESVSV